MPSFDLVVDIGKVKMETFVGKANQSVAHQLLGAGWAMPSPYRSCHDRLWRR